MEIIVSKYSGLCSAGRRAVKHAYDNVSSLVMYGEVVNNSLIVQELIDRGAILIDSLSNINVYKDKLIMIRAHGVPKSIYDKIKHMNICDMTCPNVKKIHELVEDAHENGKSIIIIGNAKHPEVKGINGYCNNEAVIIEDMAEIIKKASLIKDKKSFLVIQTTYNAKMSYKITLECQKIIPDLEVHNTICHETLKRQEEVKELAQNADCVIILGGKFSSNTQKLYKIAQQYCQTTLHIEEPEKIDFKLLKDKKRIVIASGASTPEFAINHMVRLIQNKFGSSIDVHREGYHGRYLHDS